VIGGRVLDVTAIVGFCTGPSVYAEALVMTAIEEDIVLTIPASALTRACALISQGHGLGVYLLLGLLLYRHGSAGHRQARTVGVLL
jgi:hypothetical protein